MGRKLLRTTSASEKGRIGFRQKQKTGVLLAASGLGTGINVTRPAAKAKIKKPGLSWRRKARITPLSPELPSNSRAEVYKNSRHTGSVCSTGSSGSGSVANASKSDARIENSTNKEEKIKSTKHKSSNGSRSGANVSSRKGITSNKGISLSSATSSSERPLSSSRKSPPDNIGTNFLVIKS